MKYVICSTTVVQLALYPGHSLKENSLHNCRISIVINTSHSITNIQLALGMTVLFELLLLTCVQLLQ